MQQAALVRHGGNAVVGRKRAASSSPKDVARAVEVSAADYVDDNVRRDWKALQRANIPGVSGDPEPAASVDPAVLAEQTATARRKIQASFDALPEEHQRLSRAVLLRVEGHDAHLVRFFAKCPWAASKFEETKLRVVLAAHADSEWSDADEAAMAAMAPEERAREVKGIKNEHHPGAITLSDADSLDWCFVSVLASPRGPSWLHGMRVEYEVAQAVDEAFGAFLCRWRFLSTGSAFDECWKYAGGEDGTEALLRHEAASGKWGPPPTSVDACVARLAEHMRALPALLARVYRKRVCAFSYSLELGGAQVNAMAMLVSARRPARPLPTAAARFADSHERFPRAQDGIRTDLRDSVFPKDTDENPKPRPKDRATEDAANSIMLGILVRTPHSRTRVKGCRVAEHSKKAVDFANLEDVVCTAVRGVIGGLRDSFA